MGGKIERRREWAGSGMLGSRDYIDELEDRRLKHERVTRGKPEKPFSAILAEKMQGKPDSEEEEEESRPEGAIEPHMGLQLGQSTELVGSGKGRRAGRVIVKG